MCSRPPRDHDHLCIRQTCWLGESLETDQEIADLMERMYAPGARWMGQVSLLPSDSPLVVSTDLSGMQAVVVMVAVRHDDGSGVSMSNYLGCVGRSVRLPGRGLRLVLVFDVVLPEGTAVYVRSSSACEMQLCSLDGQPLATARFRVDGSYDALAARYPGRENTVLYLEDATVAFVNPFYLSWLDGEVHVFYVDPASCHSRLFM